MKALRITLLSIAALAFRPDAFAQSAGTAAKPEGCAKCTQSAALANTPVEAVVSRAIPGTTEQVPVGRIENIVPIAVVTAFGCETCAEKTVTWALAQGSSFDDVERALQTVAAMQKLDCFRRQFGPDNAGRLEKPLAAARRVLQQAKEHAGQ